MRDNGVLLVDKCAGMTSHDVVNLLRRKLKIKKIGHAGTLDPGATGLLIMLIGKATKLSTEFLNLDKVYSVVLRLGVKTKTADMQGEIIETNDVPQFSPDYIQEKFSSFKGEQVQIPPMVSAKKINGKKLYVLARKGIEVERKPQKIEISSLEILKIKLPEIFFVMRCSKGTYVRTLCEDIGESFGCGACMHRLRRISIGKYCVEQALSIDKILQLSEEQIEEHLFNL